MLLLSSLSPFGCTMSARCLQLRLLNRLQSQWRSYREKKTFQIGPIGETNINFSCICLFILTSLIEHLFACPLGLDSSWKKYFGDWDRRNQKGERPREREREGGQLHISPNVSFKKKVKTTNRQKVQNDPDYCVHSPSFTFISLISCGSNLFFRVLSVCFF